MKPIENISQLLEKIEGAYADNTIRAYRRNLTNFQAYCQQTHQAFLPATNDTLVGFIDHLLQQNLSAHYIRRHMTAIAHLHRMSRYPDPTLDPEIKLAMRKVFRQQGRFQKQAYPIQQEQIERMLSTLGNDLYSHRDRVLLLIAYENLLRRSELVGLRMEDLKSLDHPQYCAKILLKKSKTDPFREGRWLYLTKETYTAITTWIKATNMHQGYLLRGIRKGNHLTQQLTGCQVNKILKKRAVDAGLTKEVVDHISGHSIRVGAAQDLCLQGLSLPQIMAKGRWVKTETLMRYIEHTII